MTAPIRPHRAAGKRTRIRAAGRAFLSLIPALRSVSPGFARIVREQRDLVVSGVPKVANVNTGSAGGTKARPALVRAAGRKRGGMKVANLLLTARLECDHGAVPGRGRQSVEGWPDVETRQSGTSTGRPGQHVAQPPGTFPPTRSQGPAGAQSRTVLPGPDRRHRSSRKRSCQTFPETISGAIAARARSAGMTDRAGASPSKKRRARGRAFSFSHRQVQCATAPRLASADRARCAAAASSAASSHSMGSGWRTSA